MSLKTTNHNGKLYELKLSNLERMQSLEGTVEINVNSTPLTNIVFFVCFFSLTKTDSTSKPLPPIYTTCNKQQLEKHTPKQEPSLSVQLGHFLKINADALAVKQNKVNVFQ